MAQDAYEFKDASGLIVHVKHVFTPMKLLRPKDSGLSRNPKHKWKEEIHQQPSSEIYVEVPESCGLSIAEVYTAFTGNTAPENYEPKGGGNRLKIGTVKGTWDQGEVMNSLRESGLFEEKTIDAVNACCNTPTPIQVPAQATSVAKS